jgi:hypothetical protein
VGSDLFLRDSAFPAFKLVWFIKDHRVNKCWAGH